MINFYNRFDQAFYYSPIGMALVALDGQWLKVNPTLCQITGYSEEELLSRHFQDITLQDDLQRDVDYVEELIEGKKDSYEIEKRYIHKNGSIVWVLLTVSIVRDGNEALYFIAQVQDVTERKRLESHLMESEERFRNLLTYTPDPILVHDEEMVLYANEAAADLAGTTVMEMVGESIQTFILPTMLDKTKSLIEDILDSKKPISDIEIKFRSKNGHVYDMVLSAIPIIYSGKNALLVSYRNITERKKMEGALQESEERYRHLVESSPLGIIIHQKGIIQYANATATQLLGANGKEELIGSRIIQFVHPEFRMIASNRIESVEQKGEFVQSIYEKFIRIDGQVIDVEVKGMPLQLNGESAVEVVFWDATEKKKEEDLIRYRAYHDTLTDLPNRLKFQLDLEEEIAKDRTFTIMYLDLHGLKIVNDSYGHQAGDLALIKVTARLTGGLGSRGLIYRLGGDEFAIVLPGQKREEEIKEITENLNEVIKQPIYIANSIVEVTSNFGVVYYPNHGVDMEFLLRHADMAMYHAKKTDTLYKIYDQ